MGVDPRRRDSRRRLLIRMAANAVDLAAVAIVEKDKHGDVLVAWSYPQVSALVPSFMVYSFP